MGQKLTFADVRGVGGAFFIVKGVTQRLDAGVPRSLVQYKSY